MKRIISLAITALLIAACVAVCFVPAYAADENLALNATVLSAPAYQTTYNGIVNDGIEGGANYDNKWAGFYNNNAEDDNFDGVEGFIVLDLGKSCNLSSFRTNIWGAGASGISAVGAIEVLVSDDNSTWTQVASTSDDPGLSGDPAWVELVASASGRYVKFGYTKVQGVFIFVSEVEVYGSAAGDVDEPATDAKKTIDILTGHEWTLTDGGEFPPILTEADGVLNLKAEGGWPSITYTFDEPITISSDAVIACDFSIVSGSTSIHLDCDNGKSIYLHQFTDAALDGVGDLATAGDYSLTGKVTDYAWNVYDASVAYAGKEQITDESITITGITIFASAAPAEVNIKKLTVEVADDTPATSEPASDTPATPTSDSGIIAFAVIAALAVAGAIVVKKSR